MHNQKIINSHRRNPLKKNFAERIKSLEEHFFSELVLFTYKTERTIFCWNI